MTRNTLLTLIPALLFGASTLTAAPQVGETAKDFSLPNLEGESRTLKGALGSGPVVLVVLRGFPGYQCPLCNRQVGQLLSKQADFAKAGARIVLIYPGPSSVDLKAKAIEFKKDRTLPAGYEMLLDQDYTMVNAYGLRWDAPKETAYPSTFVLDSKGKIAFAKVSNSHGGRAGADEILEALAKLKM